MNPPAARSLRIEGGQTPGGAAGEAVAVREMPGGAAATAGGPLARADAFGRRLERRKRLDRLFHGLVWLASVLGVVVLATLLIDVTRKAWGWLDWQFLTSYPSRFPERAGIRAALAGTVWVMSLTAALAFPIGVATAIYLEEMAPRRRLTAWLQANIANLAGVPSIVYGLLGLGVFVRLMDMGRSVLAGALTMTLLILPVVVIAAQEALRAVPPSIRHAAYALGCTRWQVVAHAVLPSALPGILTGCILAMSRAIGETAPLIAIGALTFVAFTPASIFDPFTVLPIQIFNWTSRPQEEFRHLAAAGILVLLVVLLGMNGLAIWLRHRTQRRLEGWGG